MGGRNLDEATTVPPHRRLKEIFCMMFPSLGNDIVRWGSIERYSVRLDMKSGQSLVFHFESKSKWRLESIGSYLKDDWKGRK